MAVDDPTPVTLYTDKLRVPFLVDADDVWAVQYYRWRLDKTTGYITTTVGKHGCGPRRSLTLHQFLLGAAPASRAWDHINRDKMDNRRRNLRVATVTENNRNQGPRSDNRSGVRGVYWHEPARSWVAEIRPGGGLGKRYLGCFRTLEDAADARRMAELEYWK